MKDVVQLQNLTGGPNVSRETKKWRRGKSPKEEIRLGAVDRLRARLKAEDITAVAPEPVFEAAPAKIAEVTPVIIEAVEPAVLPEAEVLASSEFPDELLIPPAPTEEVTPTEELPLEAPVESAKARRRRKLLEESEVTPESLEPVVLEMADKAENT